MIYSCVVQLDKNKTMMLFSFLQKLISLTDHVLQFISLLVVGLSYLFLFYLFACLFVFIYWGNTVAHTFQRSDALRSAPL